MNFYCLIDNQEICKMKIPEIKAQIVEKFIDLDRLAHIKPTDKSTVPLWQVGMGNWHATEGINDVWYRKGMIRVIVSPRENNVKINKKPFFMWEKWVLKRVSKALTDILDNFNNYDVVEKKEAPIRVYTQEAIAELKKAGK